MKPDTSFVLKSGHFHLLTTLTGRRRPNRNRQIERALLLECGRWLIITKRIYVDSTLFSIRYADVLPEVLFRKFYANVRRPPDCHIDVP